MRALVRRKAVLPLVPLQGVDEAWMQMQAVAPSDIPGVGDLSDDMVHTWVDDATQVFKREIGSHDAN